MRNQLTKEDVMDTEQPLELTLENLIQGGAHFGHRKDRLDPRMKPYILEERNGISLIDLSKTIRQIHKASAYIKKCVGQNKKILVVGTKKQASSIVSGYAEEMDEFYVSERWLGGMLTNLNTIRASIKEMERLEKIVAEGREGLTKKEFSQLNKRLMKLQRNLNGIRAMRKPPGLLIIIDTKRESIALKEAKILGIPTLGIADTNCNPDELTHLIVANDDSYKSIKVIMNALKEAALDGKKENVAAAKESAAAAKEKEQPTKE